MNIKLLTKLIDVPGISGYEKNISNFAINLLERKEYQVEINDLGTIIAKKEFDQNKKTIMIDAHMDEVGFLVTGINKHGLISFAPIGGIWSEILNMQLVDVWTINLNNSYPGVIVFPSSSTHQQKGKTPLIDKMLIDIGMTSDKEILDLNITIGSTITFSSPTIFTKNRGLGKAIDNRLGLYLLLETALQINLKDYNYNVVFVISSQEEVGLRGSRTATYKLNPDLSIVIDISPANDLVTQEFGKGILGSGTMIRHQDAHVIYSKKVINLLQKVIKENEIKAQDYFSLGGTNAGIIQLTKSGKTVIPIGLVARNLHTGTQIFDLNDLVETQKLILSLLKTLDEEMILNLKERF
ncbi:MAG: hypothetical protein GQ557_02775 [Mycoplasmataceae bacterium]|nr:hypothetical protein [Mycoplasmataceae bacterium]